MTASGSGAGSTGGPNDAFRLLPFVHHPPARVAVPARGDGSAARGLDARGYRVTTYGGATEPGITVGDSFYHAAPGAFDLICETGGYEAAADRAEYVQACAHALRPGGLLFGAFPGGAAELLHRVSGSFDSARLDPSSEREGWFEAVFVRR